MKRTILFGLVYTCISRSYISAANAPDCKPISECELCEEGPQRQSGTKGCEETGKHRKWSCPKHDDDEEEDEEEYDIEYRSCKRTTIEEEYNVIRFEALCLLISLFSLRTVRREKLLNESLFDKLKRQAKIQQQQQQQQQGKALTREQEMTPLVSSTSNVIDNVHSDDFPV
jgi:hypothetical protein